MQESQRFIPPQALAPSWQVKERDSTLLIESHSVFPSTDGSFPIRFNPDGSVALYSEIKEVILL